MAKESVTKALADAKVKYTDINQAVVGYVYGLYIHFHRLHNFWIINES